MERPQFGSPKASPAPAPTAAGGEDPIARHKRLTQQYNQLNENRVRKTMLLQQATEEDERCRQEAASYGASSPEELEQIIAKRREEESQALDRFEAELADESRRQAEIEQSLATIEK